MRRLQRDDLDLESGHVKALAGDLSHHLLGKDAGIDRIPERSKAALLPGSPVEHPDDVRKRQRLGRETRERVIHGLEETTPHLIESGRHRALSLSIFHTVVTSDGSVPAQLRR
jgi:hypothetical protein